MAVTALFSIGTRAMTASYAALQTTGNNIANANTAGYSRQQVDLASAGGQLSWAGACAPWESQETPSAVSGEGRAS